MGSRGKYQPEVDDIVEEVNVKGVLKSSIFVVQKATAPKTGVEFCQGSICAIRSSLAMMSGDVAKKKCLAHTNKNLTL